MLCLIGVLVWLKNSELVVPLTPTLDLKSYPLVINHLKSVFWVFNILLMYVKCEHV